MALFFINSGGEMSLFKGILPKELSVHQCSQHFYDGICFLKLSHFLRDCVEFVLCTAKPVAK